MLYRRLERRVQSEMGLRELLAGRRGTGPHTRRVSYLVREGLANRLNSHLVASYIARETGRVLTPVWVKTDACAAEYDDLFVSETDPDWTFGSCRVIRYLDERNQESCDITCDYPEDLIVLDLGWQSIFLVHLISRLGGPESLRAIAADCMKLRPDVAAFVDAERAHWSEQMLGVHIRRGDFVKYGQSINVGQYITAAERVLATMPGAKIFLSSDGGKDDLQPFFDAFEGRVRFNPSLPRNKEDGVRRALADFTLLGACQHVILTPLSSFGRVAATLGGANAELV